MIGQSRSQCGRGEQLSSALIGNQALQGRLLQQLGRLCLGAGQEHGQGELLECPRGAAKMLTAPWPSPPAAQPRVPRGLTSGLIRTAWNSWLCSAL